LQVIYKGKSDAITPGGMKMVKGAATVSCQKGRAARVEADEAGHDVFFTPNHWSTPVSFKRYLENIIIKDYKETCAAEGLESGKQAAIIIMDLYRVSSGRGRLHTPCHAVDRAVN
jgi:hypothetical protein